MPLNDKVRKLAEDDFSASDDYEISKFERFVKHNEKL